MLEVCFIVIATGVRVTKVFDSYPECRKFVNKLRHSKKCRLVYSPDVSR